MRKKLPSLFATPFYLAAGADPEILAECEARERILYFCTGLALLLTATWAFIAGQGLLSYVMPDSKAADNAWARNAIGLFYAVFIFNIDRLFVVTTKAKESGKTKAIKTVIRIVISILISSVISEITILMIYKEEIKATVPLIAQERTYAFLNEVMEKENNIKALDAKIDSLYKNAPKTPEMVELEKKIERAAADIGKAKADVEMAKTLCRTKPQGGACNRVSYFEGQFARATAQREMYEKQLAEERGRQNKGLDSKIADLRAAKSVNLNEIAAAKTKMKSIAETFKGLMANQLAYQRLKEISGAPVPPPVKNPTLANDSTKVSPSVQTETYQESFLSKIATYIFGGPVQVFYYLFTFLFIFLEVAPVVIKSFFVETPMYEQRANSAKRKGGIRQDEVLGLWDFKGLYLEFRPDKKLRIGTDTTRTWSFSDNKNLLTIKLNGVDELVGEILEVNEEYMLLKPTTLASNELFSFKRI